MTPAIGIALAVIGYSLCVAAVLVFLRIGPMADRRAIEATPREER